MSPRLPVMSALLKWQSSSDDHTLSLPQMFQANVIRELINLYFSGKSAAVLIWALPTFFLYLKKSCLCGWVYWNVAPGMDWFTANSYPDSLKLETSKKARFKENEESTHSLNLYWRVLRCNINWRGVFVWPVGDGGQSQKQIFGVVGNLRSPG